jgi:hypothetical protein
MTMRATPPELRSWTISWLTPHGQLDRSRVFEHEHEYEYEYEYEDGEA